MVYCDSLFSVSPANPEDSFPPSPFFYFGVPDTKLFLLISYSFFFLYIFCDIYFLINRLIFKRSYRFIEKLNRKDREFPVSPIINIIINMLYFLSLMS